MDIQTFLDNERIKYNQKGMILCMSYKNHKKIYVSGTSMTTVPVNKNMHYRIGGQGIPVLSTLFLILVDKEYLRLDDKIYNFLPKVPNGKLITLQMLCNMTSGLEDVINNPVVSKEMETNVFKQWKSKELLNIIYDTIPLYPPGERFYFGHITNMLLLGQAMKIKMKISVKDLVNKYIIDELNLKNTQYKNSQEIENPVLHTYTNNRISYYEDSTYWNGSWGSYTTKIISNANDVNILAKHIGSGSLISKKLYNIQLCNPSIKSIESKANKYYGMGCVIGGFSLDHLKSDKYPYPIIWTNESEDGNFGIWAHIPSKKITINIQSNTYNGDDFKIDDVLQDLLNTYTLCKIKYIVCTQL